MGLHLRFCMCVCDKWRLYDYDSASDCSSGIGKHVWVYVSECGREYLSVSE